MNPNHVDSESEEHITDVWIAWLTRKPMLITRPDADGVLRIVDPEGVKEFNMSALFGRFKDSFMIVGYVPDLSAKFPNVEKINVGVQMWGPPRNIMIPRNLGAYKNLKRLWIDHANIDHLPEELCELPNLTFLLANRNHIKVIPDSIGKLTRLQTLDLENNEIRVIPPAMKALVSLIALHLPRNEITDVFTYFNLPEHLLIRPKDRECPYGCFITCHRSDGTKPTVYLDDCHVRSVSEINLNLSQPNELVMRMLARKLRIPLEHRLCRIILEKIITRDIILE